MVRGVEVLGGVPVPGVVAAPDVSAGATQAQVHPGVAHGETFLATIGVRRGRADGFQVDAGFGHGTLPL